jgi:hypothetical protein
MVTTTHIEELDVLCHCTNMERRENSIIPSLQKPSLRLMRFSFEPNPELLKETESFIQASHRPSPIIRFYASRQLLIQTPDYYRHEANLQRT